MRTSTIVVIAALCVAAAGLVVWLTGGDKPAPEPAPVTAVVEPTPDPQPEVIAPAIVRPSFDVVRISREGTGVIAGRAAPDAFVEVHADDQIIGRVRANSNGEWVLIFDSPLKAGPRELSLTSHLGAAEPVQSDNIVIVSVPELVETPPDGVVPENGVLAIMTPRYGSGVTRVLQKPGSFRSEIELAVQTLDFDDQGKAIFSGTATPNATIRVYLDTNFEAVISADPTGKWVFEPTNLVYAGDHVLRLDQILEGDDVEIRVEQPFNTAEALDMDLAESHAIIKPGNNLWHVARRVYGSGTLYTQIFRANDERIRDPNLIYPGQKFLLPRADASDQITE